MKNLSPIPALFLALLSFSLPACNRLDAHEEGQHAEGQHEGLHEEGHHERHKIVATSPVRQDIVSTQRYVCQIHSRRHIEVRALEGGYLEEILIQEGQAVKKGDLMFRILPVLHRARLNSDIAEADLAEIEYLNTKRLFERKVNGRSVVAQPEVAMAKAKLAKAKAKVELARAELGFTEIKASFDGIVDRQLHQQGSLIKEDDILTTLSDNDVMWVYFNVPEARYLEYKAELDRRNYDGDDVNLKIELMLANGENFRQPGKIGAIEADFDNTTGNIPFRADFPNPNGLLRNGQTGTIMIHRELADALVIPQRATYEILAKRYVYVVGDDGVVHQRDITVLTELEDIFVINDGLEVGDKIIFEGIQQVRDGDQVDYEFREPGEILANLKYHAE